MSRKSLMVLLTLLVGLTSFLIMVSSFDRADSEPTEQITNSKVLELFAENIKTLRFDTSGHVNQIFTAGQLTQYQAETHTALSSPKLESFKDTIPTWSIQSNQGQYNQDGIIQLKSDVKAVQIASGQNIIISTDQLVINERTGIVSTDQPVIMSANSGILNAVGMTFDMNEEIIQFDADVNATYEPGYE